MTLINMQTFFILWVYLHTLLSMCCVFHLALKSLTNWRLVDNQGMLILDPIGLCNEEVWERIKNAGIKWFPPHWIWKILSLWPRSTYLAWCAACTISTMQREHFSGIYISSREIKIWWLHLGHITERECKSKTVSADVWGHNEFSMELLTIAKSWKDLLSRPIVMSFSITPPFVVGRSLHLIQIWNPKPLWN